MIIFSPSVLPRHSLALPLECIRGERGCIESQESHPAPCLRYWVKRLILREAIPGMLSGQSEMAFTHVPWCQFSPWKEKEIPSRRDQTFTASPTWVGLAVLRVLSPHQSLGIVGVTEDPAQKMGASAAGSSEQTGSPIHLTLFRQRSACTRLCPDTTDR